MADELHCAAFVATHRSRLPDGLSINGARKSCSRPENPTIIRPASDDSSDDELATAQRWLTHGTANDRL